MKNASGESALNILERGEDAGSLRKRLLLAVQGGEGSIVSTSMENGAEKEEGHDKEDEDEDGLVNRDDFLVAIRSCAVDEVQEALESGVVVDDGCCRVAIQAGHTGILRLLLDHGVNINLERCMINAIKCHNLGIVQMLLSLKDFDPTSWYMVDQSFHRVAEESGFEAAVPILRAAYEKIMKPKLSPEEFATYVDDQASDDTGAQESRGQELEHLQRYFTGATSSEGEATSSRTGPFGPGYATAGQSDNNSDKYGAAMKADYSDEGYQWTTGMHATRLDDVPEEDEPETTSLHHHHRTSLDNAFDENETLVMRASEGNVAAVEELLRSNVTPQIASGIAAARNGHYDVLNLLLANGLEADYDTAKRPETPMTAAIRHKQLNIVQLLLEQDGFDPTRRDGFGRTYYDLASERLWVEGRDLFKRACDGVNDATMSHASRWQSSSFHGPAPHNVDATQHLQVPNYISPDDQLLNAETTSLSLIKAATTSTDVVTSAIPQTNLPISKVGNSYVCGFCGMEFTGRYRRGNCYRHIRNTHLKKSLDPTLACQVCGKIFKRQDATRKHEERKHGLHMSDPRSFNGADINSAVYGLKGEEQSLQQVLVDDAFANEPDIFPMKFIHLSVQGEGGLAKRPVQFLDSDAKYSIVREQVLLSMNRSQGMKEIHPYRQCVPLPHGQEQLVTLTHSVTLSWRRYGTTLTRESEFHVLPMHVAMKVDVLLSRNEELYPRMSSDQTIAEGRAEEVDQPKLVGHTQASSAWSEDVEELGSAPSSDETIMEDSEDEGVLRQRPYPWSIVAEEPDLASAPSSVIVGGPQPAPVGSLTEEALAAMFTAHEPIKPQYTPTTITSDMIEDDPRYNYLRRTPEDLVQESSTKAFVEEFSRRNTDPDDTAQHTESIDTASLSVEELPRSHEVSGVVRYSSNCPPPESSSLENAIVTPEDTAFKNHVTSQQPAPAISTKLDFEPLSYTNTTANDTPHNYMIAAPAKCQHQWQVVKSDTTLIQWNCIRCHSGPYLYIYECQICKIKTCQPCTSKS